MGISGGATSTLIPLPQYALGGNLFNFAIIAAATNVPLVLAGTGVLWTTRISDA